jgi:hypothetical protein
MRSDSIAAQPSMCGWMAYTPPKEIGQGREIPSWPVGFSIYRQGHHDGNSPRMATRTLSYGEALRMAEIVDEWLTFEHRRSEPRTCVQWVRAIIAEIPKVYGEALESANERVSLLREARAGAEGAAEALATLPAEPTF